MNNFRNIVETVLYEDAGDTDLGDLPFRYKDIDPDNRVDTRGKSNPCERCGKAIKTKKFRAIRYAVLMNTLPAVAIHPDDIEAFESTSRSIPREDYGWCAIGLDCARQIGLEWSIPADQVPEQKRT